MERARSNLVIGMDIGSTTVKAAVVDRSTREIVWSDYQRHNTRQPEKVLELLEAIEAALPELSDEGCEMFMTGSGAAPLTGPTGGRFSYARTGGDGAGDACDPCWFVHDPGHADSDGNCPLPPYTEDPRCGDACQE